MNLFKIILLFLIVCPVFPQSSYLFNIDESQYPEMSAQLLSIDEMGNQDIGLTPDQVDLLENGLPVSSLKIDCPNEIRPRTISAVLTIDISGSMLDSNNYSLAIDGLSEWSRIINNANETAIIGFNDFPFILSDYSQLLTNYANFLRAITPFGGTDYQAAFLHPSNGAISMAERASNPEPIIILLSDGTGNFDETEVLSRAKESGIKIYSIILQEKCPDILRFISKESGGLYFENVSTPEEIVEIFNSIYHFAIISNPCEISWVSNDCQLKKEAVFKKKESFNEFNFNYSVENSNLAGFSYIPDRYLIFDDVALLESGTRWVTIKAEKKDIFIEDLDIDNPAFVLKNTDGREFPFTLEEGEEWAFQIEFNYDIEQFEFATVKIISNACIDKEVYCVGGDATRIPGSNQLKLLYPNGGELYWTNDEDLITWEGIGVNDSVNIDISLDNGVSWNNLARKSTNFQNEFKVPNQESNEALIRLTQFSREFGGEYLNINTDNQNVNKVSWQDEGSFLAIAAEDSTIRVVNVVNGATFTLLEGHSSQVNTLDWSPDAVRIVSCSQDSVLKVWNSLSRSELIEVNTDEEIFDVTWSPDGKYIATGGENNSVVIRNPVNGEIIETLNYHTQDVLSLEFNEDGSKLASSGKDSTIKVYSTETWELLNDFRAHESWVMDIAWNRDQIVSVSLQNQVNSVKIWNLGLGQPRLIPVNEPLRAVDWMGNFIVYTGESGDIFVYDLVNQEIKYKFQKTIWINNSIDFSPDGNRFAVGINGKNSSETVRFYSIESFPIQEDISDSTFSIERLVLETSTLDFGDVVQGKIKTLNFTDLVLNKNLQSIDIDSVRITIDPFNSFSANFESNFTLESNSFYSEDINFAPNRVGRINGVYSVFVSNLEFKGSLTGNGIAPTLPDFVYDFGKLNLTTSKNGVINITNNSLDELNVSNAYLDGPDTDNFEFLQGGGSFRINPGDTRRFVTRFTANELGKTNARIVIEHDGIGSPSQVILLAEGIETNLDFVIHDDGPTTCQVLDTTLVELINYSSDNITVVDHFIESNRFEIINDLRNVMIEADSRDSLFIEYDPSNGKFLVDNLIIESNSKNQFDTVYIVDSDLSPLIEFTSNSFIAFDQTEEDLFESKTITIINNGDLSTELDPNTFPVDYGMFIIRSASRTFLEPGETSDIEVSFKGGKDGDEFIEEFFIIDNCRNSIDLRLEARVNTVKEYPEITSNKEYDLVYFCPEADTLFIPIKVKNGSKLEIDFVEHETIYHRFLNRNDFINSEITDSSTIYLSYDDAPPGNYTDYLILHTNTEDGLDTITINYEQVNTSFEILDEPIIVEITDRNPPFLTDFIIQNNSEYPLSFAPYVAYAFGDYQVVGIDPLITPALGSSTVTVAYNSTLPDTTRTPFVAGICDYMDSLDIIAISNIIPEFTLKIADHKKDIGIPFNLSVDLVDSKNLLDSDYEGILVDIKYKSELMTYSLDPLLEVKMGEEFSQLSIELLLEDYNSGWEIPRFTALWGRDSITDITIENATLLNSNDPLYYTGIDGSLEVLGYCDLLGSRVFIELTNTDIQINPNPVEDILSFSIDSSIDSYKVSIYNLAGQKVKSISNTNLINVKDLSPGVYILEFDYQGLIKTHRFMKN